jgi:hypothetical protein
LQHLPAQNSKTFKYKNDNETKKCQKGGKMMNKKGIFAMMHPGLMFFLGLIIGIALTYYLAMQGIIPF